ncbi:MAG: hypothetical protein SBU_000475 [Candidatus Syntrophoarchaeum butanivorans]|uniref:Ferritin-like diiron domain-containing protein n=1 Tax=Candidatus Syntropharchaeum butanivorans TaxID=1839936 RepID=A0A1F2P5P7_9EURY|nr:MAG: hypothetical protein SBU_000475 [Candidatus Syntrophoarchaeum butanivorans]
MVVYLRQLAMEEAAHAARAAELLGMVGKMKDEIEKMVEGERNADSGKMEAARIAREEGNEDLPDSSRRQQKMRHGIEQGLKES